MIAGILGGGSRDHPPAQIYDAEYMYRPGEGDEASSDGEGDNIHPGSGGWAAAAAAASRAKREASESQAAAGAARNENGGGTWAESGGANALSSSATARSRRVSFRDRVQHIRARMNTFFEEPHSSRSSFAFSILIFLLIILSAVALCVETLPTFVEQVEDPDYNSFGGPWFVIEVVCVTFFTFEFFGRLLSCPSYRKFVLSAMNWADFIAILPFYIEVMSTNDSKAVDLRIIRMIRLARIFRVFKLSRYSAGLQVTGRAMANSADALTLLVFFTAIAMLIFSSSLYYAERGKWDSELRRWINVRGEAHAFQSIPDTFWWCITTLTTVGYGDEVPVTVAGKIIGGLTMMAGILIIALPTSVIGANFMQEWKRHQMRLGQISKERERMEHRGRHENIREYRARISREHEVLCDTLREISEFVKYSSYIYDVAFKDPAYAAGNAESGKAGAAAAASGKTAAHGSAESLKNAGSGAAGIELSAIAAAKIVARRAKMNLGLRKAGAATGAAAPVVSATAAGGTHPASPPVSPSRVEAAMTAAITAATAAGADPSTAAAAAAAAAAAMGAALGPHDDNAAHPGRRDAHDPFYDSAGFLIAGDDTGARLPRHGPENHHSRSQFHGAHLAPPRDSYDPRARPSSASSSSISSSGRNNNNNNNNNNNPVSGGASIIDDLTRRLNEAEARAREVEVENERLRRRDVAPGAGAGTAAGGDIGDARAREQHGLVHRRRASSRADAARDPPSHGVGLADGHHGKDESQLADSAVDSGAPHARARAASGSVQLPPLPGRTDSTSPIRQQSSQLRRGDETNHASAYRAPAHDPRAAANSYGLSPVGVAAGDQGAESASRRLLASRRAGKYISSPVLRPADAPPPSHKEKKSHDL